MNVAILGGLAGKRSTWLSGYSYRKSFTYSRASGAVENYQVKILVGESSGIELATNGGFDSDTTGWTPWQCTLASVSGGQSGNCLQITRTSGDEQQAKIQSVTLIPGARYSLTGYVKSGTSGNETAILTISDDSSPWAWNYDDTVTTSNDWQLLSVEFTAPSPNGRINLRKMSATEGTMLFDTISLTLVADCNGHCLSTFNDIRFTDSDGNELDYWIESISGTTPNQIATVWVELDSVGTSATTFYMFYGKADAASASSGANTFILFDDFERGSNEDAVGGDWSVITGSVLISTDQHYGGTRSAKFVGSVTGQEINIGCAASDNVAIRLRLRKADGAQMYPVSYGNGTKRIATQLDSGEDINYYDTAYRDTGVNVTVDTWHLFEVRNISFSGGTYDILLDDVSVKTSTPMYTNGSYDDTIRVSSGTEDAGDCYIDNFIVRNWRSVEPALGSWGSEETA